MKIMTEGNILKIKIIPKVISVLIRILMNIQVTTGGKVEEVKSLGGDKALDKIMKEGVKVSQRRMDSKILIPDPTLRVIGAGEVEEEGVVTIQEEILAFLLLQGHREGNTHVTALLRVAEAILGEIHQLILITVEQILQSDTQGYLEGIRRLPGVAGAQ